MNTIFIDIENEVKKMIPKLRKDLMENEIICPFCDGLGMVITDHVYGLKGETNKEAFPYNHQSFTTCTHCYNGVQRICQYCKNPLEKGHLEKCSCETYQILEREKLEKETYENAVEVLEENVSTLLYCEEIDDYFNTVDAFLEFFKEQYCGEYYNDETDDYSEEVEKLIPERLWVTEIAELNLNAESILEDACSELHEEAFAACNINKLQEILDIYVKEQTDTKTYFPSYNQYVRTNK